MNAEKIMQRVPQTADRFPPKERNVLVGRTLEVDPKTGSLKIFLSVLTCKYGLSGWFLSCVGCGVMRYGHL